MRAREFITEAKGPQGTRTDPAKEFERAHPGMVMPGGRGDVYWGRYYDFYRVASLAGMDPKDIDAIDEVSFFGNLPVFSAYTEYDQDKLKAIMKKLRMKPTDGVSNGSREVEEVNATSPVKSFKGYPR
jgi:hypothetical protein